MPKARLTALTLGLGVFVCAAMACSDDAADKLGARGPGSSGGTTADGGPGANPGGPPPELVLFQAVEPDLQQKCGLTCHDKATYKPTPPAFLAGPDAYKSIKAQPGAIVADYYQSVLLQKGAHAGPAVSNDPTFEQKMIDWLKMEAAIIQSQKKPTTDPVAVKNGPNDIDMTKSAVAGLAGVHITFDASLLGGILSLNNIKLVAAAGTDVHILKPRLIKVLAAPDSLNRREIPDAGNTFGNIDQVIPGGTAAVLGPGAAFITSAGWSPFDFAKDKIRIEVEKLEPGKVQVLEQPKVCKDVAGFTNNVLPAMRGQAGGFDLNCSNCHGNGLAGMSLNTGDQTVVCNQVLQKLNEANIAGSLLVTKVTGDAHNGGTLQAPTSPATAKANWTAVFVNNKAVFF